MLLNSVFLNCRCAWSITVNSGFYIELQFTEFDVYENPVNSCHDDQVIITDFDLQGSPIVIGKSVALPAFVFHANKNVIR
jgi:hypothetical protein